MSQQIVDGVQELTTKRIIMEKVLDGYGLFVNQSDKYVGAFDTAYIDIDKSKTKLILASIPYIGGLISPNMLNMDTFESGARLFFWVECRCGGKWAFWAVPYVEYEGYREMDLKRITKQETGDSSTPVDKHFTQSVCEWGKRLKR